MKLHLLAFLLVFSPTLFAQNPYIHAESVGEWQIKEKLSPEYHYNSVGVYLINEQQLKTLFDPSKLSKADRKRTGIKQFDVVESLFFQLDIPNPIKEDDYLSFPLYAFDLSPSTNFKSARSHGKILDRISDEDLNGRGLEANARIEMVNKNELLEMAYKISSNIQKLLGNPLFEKPDIWQVMQKAQHFFESRYKGKMVAEFSIPILPERADYEYIIESASLHQIKWSFQESVDSYKGNIWSDLRHAATTTEEDLLDRPSRLSKLKKHPFLLIIRYKSAYALPTEQQLSVDLTEDYLDLRRKNLLEFKRESIQYQSELIFTELLQEALTLKQSIATYIEDKSKGQLDHQQLEAIAAQYHTLLFRHHDLMNQAKGSDAEYYAHFYKTTYFKFFNQIEQLLLQDPQIQEISQTPTTLLKWHQQSKDSLSKEALYQHLKKLQPYRQLVSMEQISGLFPFLVQEKAVAIEQALFGAITSELPYTQEEKLAHFQTIEQQYSLCGFCKEQAFQQKAALSEHMEKELRTSLLSWQNQQLKFGRCFTELEKKAVLELGKQFPNPTSLNTSEQKLYQVFEDKIAALATFSEQFLNLSTLMLTDLPLKEVQAQLATYKSVLENYQQASCHLLHGGLLSKEDLHCVATDCKLEMP